MEETSTLDGGMATPEDPCASAAATPRWSARKTGAVKAAGARPATRTSSATTGGCGAAADHASGEARTSAQRAAAALHTTPGAPGRSAPTGAEPREASQSEEALQLRPGTQRKQEGPPQSASDSLPSRAPSKHDAGAGVAECEGLFGATEPASVGVGDGPCEAAPAASLAAWDGDAVPEGVGVYQRGE